MELIMMEWCDTYGFSRCNYLIVSMLKWLPKHQLVFPSLLACAHAMCSHSLVLAGQWTNRTWSENTRNFAQKTSSETLSKVRNSIHPWYSMTFHHGAFVYSPTRSRLSLKRKCKLAYSRLVKHCSCFHWACAAGNVWTRKEMTLRATQLLTAAATVECSC